MAAVAITPAQSHAVQTRGDLFASLDTDVPGN